MKISSSEIRKKFIDYLKINQEAVNFDKNKLDKAITNVFKYCIVQYSNIRIYCYK